MEGLIALLYDKVDRKVSRPDLAMIFISPGGDTGGGGEGLGVAYKFLFSMF